MSTVNDFSGNYFLTPDLPVGYGQAISNPASTLSNMVSNGLYYQEIANQDVILLNVEGYLISMYKTLSNQRLMQQFVARSTFISSQNKIRWVTRSLALSLSFESACKAIGENVTISDDWSDLATINQQLAPLYIQVWAAP